MDGRVAACAIAACIAVYAVLSMRAPSFPSDADEDPLFQRF